MITYFLCNSLVEFHSHAGNLKVSQAPYLVQEGLGERILKAAQELGYPIVDLNAPHVEGLKNYLLLKPQII